MSNVPESTRNGQVINLLIIAIFKSDLQIMKVLLDAGARVSEYQLVFAIKHAQYDIFIQLISKYYDSWFSKRLVDKIHRVMDIKYLNRPIIDYVVKWNNRAILGVVLGKYEFNRPRNQIPLLQTILQCSDVSAIRQILNDRLDLASRPVSRCGKLPIHICCKNLRYDVVEMLINDFKVDINVTDDESLTPIQHSLLSICRFSRFIFDTKGYRLMAALDSFIPLISRMLKSGATCYGDNLIHFLLRNFCDVTETETDWFLTLLQALIDSGCETNYIDERGDSLIDICARNNFQTIAELLAKNGSLYLT